MAQRVGVDFGGVLMSHQRKKCQGSAADGIAKDDGPTDDAVEGLATLVKMAGADNVFVVSKAHAATAAATVHWLVKYDVFARTGLPESNVYFCPERDAPVTNADVHIEPLAAPEGTEPAAARALTSAHMAGPGTCKGALAAHLGLTHFVDDMLPCLNSVFFHSVHPRLRLAHFGDVPLAAPRAPTQDARTHHPRAVERWPERRAAHLSVATWAQLVAEFQASFSDACQ
jgi:hypothetical protein